MATLYLKTEKLKKMLNMKTFFVFICLLMLCACTDSSTKSNTISHKEEPETLTSSVKENPYYNNSLTTGSVPYPNSSLTGSSSEIEVISSFVDDLVVIIKKNGRMVRNAYIKAGGSHTFLVPNGTYQVFFYSGKGWDPTKTMPNGIKGGFVARESFAKDDDVSLNYAILTYDLKLQRHGNFSTKSSSLSEVF